MAHVTAGLEVPAIVDTNVALWPPVSDALRGDKLMVTGGGGGGLNTGFNISDAVAFFVGSAWLVAVNVTVCCELRLAGALYIP